MTSLTKLEELQDACVAEGIHIETAQLPESIQGIYYNADETEPVISVNCSLCKNSEQLCIIAEELGHHYTSHGNLLTDPPVATDIIRKQEELASRWAHRYTVSLSSIVDSYLSGARNAHEIAEYLDIDELFFRKALVTYEARYGIFAEYNHYKIYFNPLLIELST